MQWKRPNDDGGSAILDYNYGIVLNNSVNVCMKNAVTTGTKISFSGLQVNQ